jgi:RNA recognition motif-containing protein
MQTEEAAQSAIQRLNETDLDGRKIAVNEARPKPSGGGGGGRPGGGGGRGPRREPRW